MREICEITVTQDGGAQGVLEEVIGTFILEDGKLSYKAHRSGDRTLAILMGTPAVVISNGKQMDVTAEDSPALWFHNLERTFRGTYLSAQFVT